MRVLVTGAEGFIGRNVAEAFARAGDEVFFGARSEPTDDHHLQLDLLDEPRLTSVIGEVGPDVIVNCAGIVDPNGEVANNETFTANLIRAMAASGHLGRIVVCGSAGVYGKLKDVSELPVTETTPVRPASPYGESKVAEEETAIRLGAEHDIPVTIARIFNPIGPGMGPKFLVTGVLRQLAEIRRGEREVVEVSREDDERDYVDVRDVATAIVAIACSPTPPRESVYNVGSGKAVSNGELVRLILESSGMQPLPSVRETSDVPGPLVASEADTTKLREEFDWAPRYTLEQSVKAVIDEAK